jgi:hypothetical protein
VKHSSLAASTLAAILICAPPFARQAAAHCAIDLQNGSAVAAKNGFYSLSFRNTCPQQIHVQITVTFYREPSKPVLHGLNLKSLQVGSVTVSHTGQGKFHYEWQDY